MEYRSANFDGSLPEHVTDTHCNVVARRLRVDERDGDILRLSVDYDDADADVYADDVTHHLSDAFKHCDELADANQLGKQCRDALEYLFD